MISNAPGNIVIDCLEKDKDSKWRTINTVQYFKEKYPNDELYLIIGEDSYKNFPTWFRYEDILLMATLMVVQRGNDSRDDVEKDNLTGSCGSITATESTSLLFST